MVPVNLRLWKLLLIGRRDRYEQVILCLFLFPFFLRVLMFYLFSFLFYIPFHFTTLPEIEVRFFAMAKKMFHANFILLDKGY